MPVLRCYKRIGMTKAAKLVLDGDGCATVSSIEEIVDFWTPILTTPSKEVEPELGLNRCSDKMQGDTV